MKKHEFASVDAFVDEAASHRFGFRGHAEVVGIQRLYLRVAHHIVEGEMRRTLDISSIDVEQDHQSKGLFKRLLSHCEALCVKHQLALFVECVQEPRLASFMIREGYASDGMDIGPSFGLSHQSLSKKLEAKKDLVDGPGF